MDFRNKTFDEILEMCPISLKTALQHYSEGYKKLQETGEWQYLESPYCELQSEINSSEVNHFISHELATFLRNEYIY